MNRLTRDWKNAFEERTQDFHRMEPGIRGHGEFVYQYVGDEIMALSNWKKTGTRTMPFKRR